MTYQETLDYLYQHLPMYQRIGAPAFKKDLSNTIALCAQLGNPQEKFRSVHVAGTNGKGSVSHMLAAVCQAAGLKTGLYVSPHYKDFRERIRVNGQYIPRQRVVQFVARHREMLENIQPSFFEMTVALAFDHFAREKVDIAIVEVGLGGRLDSTNVITPLLSVITNISYDHMNLLGDTLPQIAAEKAGIIKPGIPVVVGETHPESAPVFIQKATETQSEIHFADQELHTIYIGVHENGNSVYRITPRAPHSALRNPPRPSLRGMEIPHSELAVDAGGPYQERNVTTAYRAALYLQQLLPEISDAAIEAGFSDLRRRVKFMGRWQWIGRQPDILCDSAHNEAGLRAAFEAILALCEGGQRRLHMVCGFVNDKDLDKALALFPTFARYYFAKANIPRGLPADELREKAAQWRLYGRHYQSVPRALAAAKRSAGKNDLIVVIGSIFVVAEVL
jgi:dihydrofolate synthase / folylpolyglutamate synthase